MKMFSIEQLKQLSDFLKEDFKEVFATKEDFNGLKQDIRDLSIHVDRLAGLGSENKEEILIMGGGVDNVESWVKGAAPKIGLEYKP